MRVRSAFAVCGVIATIISSAPAIAQEEESFAATEEQAAANEAPAPRLQTRNYDHLEFDTVTGSYFGFATFYTDDKSEIFTGELRLLMGGSRFQGGVAIPYHAASGNGDGLSGENDVGNPRAHLKFIPLRSDIIDAGGGLMLSFPGGSDDEGISVPNIGVLPFVTGTGHLGPVDANTHIGYNFINHSNSSEGSPESILYGGSLTLPIADMLGLRLELAGQQFTSGDNRNVLAVQPGLDFVFPLAEDWGMMISGAGSYGLGSGAAGSRERYQSPFGLNTISGLSRGDWGLGLAVGVIWY